MKQQHTKRIPWLAATVVLVAALTSTVPAAQLDGPASIVLDAYGVPTIVAETEHDAIYLQGYMHAKDRLFQMDFQRRLFSGRVSEIAGASAIPQDVQLRTLGLRRAAERSLLVQTPEVLAMLQAYSDGVNAFLTDTTQPLPIEYGALQLTRSSIPLWTPTDSLTMAKGLAFGLSFDLTDIDRTVALVTYLNVCPLIGCNGLQLFNDDLYRTAPFEAGVSIPPPPPPPADPEGGGEPTPPEGDSYPEYMTDPAFADMLRDYRTEIAEIPILRKALERNNDTEGSNWFVAAGAHTDSGFPMIANDPHLSLGTPATFYEVHLYVAGGINVTGVSFPGAPYLVQGCNDTICWGSTNNPIDVTDVYQEVLLAMNPGLPGVPSHTLRNGVPEPLQLIPQVFMVNAMDGGTPDTIVNANVPAGSGGLTFVVPRRNNGPIVRVTPGATTTGISVQYTGWSATQEFETFRRFARATSMQQFKDALQFFDFGSQNWVYADIQGNVAYYTSGEVPIREDLQNFPFTPDGLTPPYLIRDGTHTRRHEWMPITAPQPGQALSTEILPFAEMPQIENPSAGYILNANNDPIGTTFDNVSWNQFRAGGGRLYLAAGYAEGYRNGRLQRLLNAELAGGGTLTLPEFMAIQGNNQLLDAEVLRPFLLQAFANATAPGAPPELTAFLADPRIAEAISRLGAWNFSTPTGIQQGYDPGDNPLALPAPSQAEIDASVAATIYAVWRGQLVQRVINTTLSGLPVSLASTAPGSAQSMAAIRRLLENFALNGGVGSSLINFFNVPGVADPSVRRDMILLGSLQNGLNLLASAQFAPAFGNSTNLDDYRWGKLHRIVFSHFLGGPFNIPAAGSPLNLAPNLPGIARAGGMGALDASSHDARADGLNEFMFSSGPARRMIATMTPAGPKVLQVIPGGASGRPGDPHQVDQLFLWLVNAYKELPVSLEDVLEAADETLTYACGDGVRGPGEQCDDGNQNNADGCDTTCSLSPTVTCLAPSAPGSADTCTASIACSAVATCIDPQGSPLGTTCDTGDGPYGFGSNDVVVSCGGASTTCTATVTDVHPPTISVDPTPTLLWPPNHHMLSVDSGVTATDACSPPTVTLSATSDEPDDGPGDGATVDDIQPGSNPLTPGLRAERSALGDGRVYTLTYTATDAAGNEATASATVVVPHDLGGLVDPMSLRASRTDLGTLLSWNAVAGAVHYNVIRTNLRDLRDTGPSYDLGSATCIEARSVSLDTYRYQDDGIPPPGEVFVYVAEFFDGLHHSTFGSPTSAKPVVVDAGGCR